MGGGEREMRGGREGLKKDVRKGGSEAGQEARREGARQGMRAGSEKGGSEAGNAGRKREGARAPNV
jgi:hypothetical protein